MEKKININYDWVFLENIIFVLTQAKLKYKSKRKTSLRAMNRHDIILVNEKNYRYFPKYIMIKIM